ncbi:MAG: DNRLRE domain-containing protein [Phycisphaeraceae bacterium]|nr:DNRLRE domain-containing protein [Phycisphaeraceae bacterium]
MRFGSRIILMGASFLTWAGVVPAWGEVIEPAESGSRDVFIYEFLPTFNFEVMGPSFQSVLAAGKTGVGHDVRTLIDFDLSSVGIQADDLWSAQLSLYVIDGSQVGFPFGNPSEQASVTAEIFAAQSAWSEAAVNWTTQPGHGVSPIASTLVAGVGQWVSFDVTSLVQDWLSGAQTQLGFVVEAANSALDPVSGNAVALVFASAAGTNRPKLELTAVPEPGTGLVLLTVLAAGAVRRRRRVK